MPAGFVCVSFARNNRLGNQITSYKVKKEEGETKVRQMGTAANCTFEIHYFSRAKQPRVLM